MRLVETTQETGTSLETDWEEETVVVNRVVKLEATSAVRVEGTVEGNPQETGGEVILEDPGSGQVQHPDPDRR